MENERSMRRSIAAAVVFCLLGSPIASSGAEKPVDRIELRQLQEELVREIRRGQEAEQREIYSLGRANESAVSRLEQTFERRLLALLLLVLLSFVVVLLGFFFVWFRLGRLEDRLFPRQGAKVLRRLGKP